MPERNDGTEPQVTAAASERRARLEAACEGLLGPVDRMKRLDGGTGGTAFEIGIGGRRLHAKLVTPDSARVLPLAAEFELLEVLAHEALGPRPVAFDAVAGVLVTEFLENYRPMASHELCEPEMLGRSCALLSRLHAVSMALPRFDPIAIARRYLRALGGIERLDAERRAMAAELLALAGEWSRHEGPAVPCHCDLVAGNFMLGPNLLLVDFEYAQLASPVLDLATLSAMNDFPPAADARLLRGYFGANSVPLSLGEFAKVRRMVALIAHFWALARPGCEAARHFVLD